LHKGKKPSPTKAFLTVAKLRPGHAVYTLQVHPPTSPFKHFCSHRTYLPSAGSDVKLSKGKPITQPCSVACTG